MKLTCNLALVDPLFVFYFFRSELGRHALLQHASTVGTPGIGQPLASLRSITVPVPPLPEQRAIAHILGTLDDKIELNRRMNETLEAMACALFKSWFVDFLPVRAKMAAKSSDPSLLLAQAEPNTWFVYAIECNDGSLYIGQTEDLRQRWLQHVGGRGGSWTGQHPPVRVPYWERLPSREAAVERERWLKTGYGRKWLKKEIAARTQTGDPLPAPQSEAARQAGGLPKPLADLFPARLVDSELGAIPQGWGVGHFGDVAEQLRDQENPLSFPDALFHHFSIPAFDEGQTAKSECGESIKSLKSRVPPGVILISKLNPEIERVWMVDVRPGERAVCSTEFLVLRARPPFKRGYVYCLARSPLFRQQIEGLVTGTSKSHQRAQVESILNLAAVIPPSPILAMFDRSANDLLSRTLESRRESRTLAALRDTLLPTLISGELRVRDAEKFIARAA